MRKWWIRRLKRLHVEDSGKIEGSYELIIIVLIGALSMFGIYQLYLWFRPYVVELVERVLNVKW